MCVFRSLKDLLSLNPEEVKLRGLTAYENIATLKWLASICYHLFWSSLFKGSQGKVRGGSGFAAMAVVICRYTTINNQEANQEKSHRTGAVSPYKLY